MLTLLATFGLVLVRVLGIHANNLAYSEVSYGLSPSSGEINLKLTTCGDFVVLTSSAYSENEVEFNGLARIYKGTTLLQEIGPMSTLRAMSKFGEITVCRNDLLVLSENIYLDETFIFRFFRYQETLNEWAEIYSIPITPGYPKLGALNDEDTFGLIYVTPTNQIKIAIYTLNVFQWKQTSLETLQYTIPTSMSMSIGNVFVGNPSSTNGGVLNSGEVHVYRLTSAGELIYEYPLYPGSFNRHSNTKFGQAVLVDGNKLFISAPGGEKFSGSQRGVVAYYKFNPVDSVWNFDDTIQNPKAVLLGNQNTRFGVSLATFTPFDSSTKYLAVNDELDYNNLYNGTVYLFKRELSTWIYEHKVKPTLTSSSENIFCGRMDASKRNLVCTYAPEYTNFTSTKFYIFTDNPTSSSSNAILYVSISLLSVFIAGSTVLFVYNSRRIVTSQTPKEQKNSRGRKKLSKKGKKRNTAIQTREYLFSL